MIKKRKKLIAVLAFLFVILFVWPVFIPPIKPTNLSYVTIKLHRTMCFGTCPEYTLTVHGDGLVEYEGSNYTWVKGKQTSRISQDEVHELVDGFYKAGYWWNLPFYWSLITDQPTTISSITIGIQTKSIFNYYGAPQRLEDLEDKIDEISGATKWLTGIDPSLLPLAPPIDYGNAVITYERTAEMSNSMPIYKLTIHGDGTVIYEGIDHVKVSGTHEYQVEKDDVKRLIDMFHGFQYLAITEEQSGFPTETSPIITTFSIDGAHNQVDDHRQFSDNLRYLYTEINSIADSDQWLTE